MGKRAPAEDIEARFSAAVDYAFDLLSEFEETTEPATVSVLLDSLTDEYWRARQARCGMDPGLVRLVVQGLIDAAKFAVDNRPDASDPELSPVVENDAPPAIFRFGVRKGAKPKRMCDRDALAYVVGAVMERFQLTQSRNAEPKGGKPLEGKTSASDAVAKANRRLGKTPAEYSSVIDAIGGVPFDRAIDEGKRRGQAERHDVEGK